MREPPQVLVQSFAIRPDEMIEMTYVQSRRQGKTAGVIETIVMDPSLVDETSYKEFLNELGEWVDAGLLQIRRELEDEEGT